MRFGYTIRASQTMLRHPRQGTERIRGRIDRRRDLRELAALRVPQSELYGALDDVARPLHEAIGAAWPCQISGSFDEVWDDIVTGLTASGVRVGLASYGGWSDCDRALAQAIWCIVGHMRPVKVIETGVAHGVTSRVILEGLERNGSGHLWSVDLPAVDPVLHSEIGIAVPKNLRSRWTYVEGTSRERLPHLLADIQQLDLLVHDSLHTGRNLRFELDSAWPVVRPGGVVVVDDIDHSLGFRTFVEGAGPSAWFAARKVTGRALWGVAIKAVTLAEPSLRSNGTRARGKRQRVSLRRTPHAVAIPAMEADPHVEASGSPETMHSVRVRRHERIEGAVVSEIADVIKTLAPGAGRLLQIHAHKGRQTLLFCEQLARPEQPVIYDQEDERDPGVRPETDFARVDVEAAVFPAPDGHFDLVVWNRDLVTVKNIVPALHEVRRVLRPGGILVVAVPNLAALHNRLLLLAGRQPTTLHIDNGDHIRGFAVQSMTRFLQRELGFEILRVTGVGLAPVTGAVLPGPLRGLSHTVVWALEKPGAITREAASEG
jgi:Methyltransferase domain